MWQIPTPLDETGTPSRVYIREDGRYVALCDQHGGRRGGKVLVFLGEKGQELRSYKLNDLFSQGELFEARQSISSLNWSYPGLFRFVPGRDQFGFFTHWGAVGLFNLATGKRLPPDAPEIAAFRQDALQIGRDDLKGGDLLRGMTLAGLLKDRESVPVLKKLLTDPSHSTIITDHRQDNYYETQLYAGRALVQILGKDAAPLLEPRLASANPSMAYYWIDLIQKTGTATRSQSVQKWAQRSRSEVRDAAISALIENGGVPIVRRHPQWLRDASKEVRYAVVTCLSEKGDSRDLPALRRAVSDRDSSVSLWALRGLIRLKPPDLDAILRRHLHEEEARIALADRGDKAQLRWCVTQLQRYFDEKSWSQSKAHIGMFELSDAARVLVRYRPSGTEAALRRISKLPDPSEPPPSRYEAIGLGGLAALGDKAALERVRKIAEIGEVSSALEAIIWLGFMKDRESIPLLRSLLQHREEWIRDEARKALKTLGAPEKEPQKSANVPMKETKASPRVSGLSTSRWWFVSFGALAVGCVGFLALRGRRR